MPRPFNYPCKFGVWFRICEDKTSGALWTGWSFPTPFGRRVSWSPRSAISTDIAAALQVKWRHGSRKRWLPKVGRGVHPTDDVPRWEAGQGASDSGRPTGNQPDDLAQHVVFRTVRQHLKYRHGRLPISLKRRGEQHELLPGVHVSHGAEHRA